ncbi:MAG TPA: hypothetical protein VK927_03935 [Adhaeribacter sp.]|nr:hypothetical protein [Adhaeribacter sp.]
MNIKTTPVFPPGTARTAFLLVLLLVLGNTPLTLFAQQKPVSVADLTMPVAGTNYAADFEKRNPDKKYPGLTFLYGFKEGDVILLDLKRDGGKATFDLEVQEYDSETVVYSRQKFSKLKDVRLTVPQRTIYKFIIRNNDPEPSAIHFRLSRRPASAEARNFNPNITWKTKYDSVFTFKDEKVLVKTELKPLPLVDKTFRVFSQAKVGSPSRVVVPFKVPEKAVHWVYWIGVGQESMKELEEMTKTFAKGSAAALSGVSPVAAFGMGLIPHLPGVQASGYVDFLFMDQAAVKPFVEQGARKPFKFASGDAIINAYGKITAAQTPKTADKTLYLGIENNNTLTGLDVAVKIIAFEAEPHYETRRVKKLSHITDSRIPVFGE